MDVKQLFQKLIQTETINEYGNEIIGMEILADYLAKNDLSYEIYYSNGNRPNLVSTLKATVPSSEALPPLVLLSHMDVVSVNEAEWTYPPFSAMEVEDCIWGRGTLDTKQLTAMHANAFVKASHLNERNRSIHFVVTADEENGSQEGMAFLSQEHPELFSEATVLSEGGGFLIEDPENNLPYMLYATAEKGSAIIRIEAKGDGGHAAAPPDDVLVLKLAENVKRLIRTPERSNEQPYVQRFEKELTPMMQLDDEQSTFASHLLEYMKRPTFTIQSIDVGEGPLNVLPSKGVITIDLRILPEMTEADVWHFIEMCGLDEDLNVELVTFEPGYVSSSQSEVIQLFEQKSRQMGLDFKWLGFTALGRTDGRFIAELQSDIFGLSPTVTNFTEVLKRVHQTDERIEVDSFRFGVELMSSVVNTYVNNSEKV
uniref:M20/M25/M40 family metallo-hydrolase n=1 Tax=uncultured Allobacillus sp. TaxID=1638025 RepID=UPI0025922658|nr:M20/M25/M40 family metallo-hydrolase [uncultured Allobacillus sp.]